MRLPEAEHAVVEEEKVVGYLMNHAHPDGRSKAAFFEAFGFRVDRWDALAAALRRHGGAWPVSNLVESAYGTRYSVDGVLETPDRRNPRVRTVWIVASGTLYPRLITAHPA